MAAVNQNDIIDSPKRPRANTDQKEIKQFNCLVIKQTKERILTTESNNDSIEYIIGDGQQSYFGVSPVKSQILSNQQSVDNYKISQQNSTQGGIKILYIQMQYCQGESLQHFLVENPE